MVQKCIEGISAVTDIYPTKVKIQSTPDVKKRGENR